MSADIVLASQSPRRKELLAKIVPLFRVIPCNADESLVPGESVESYVVRVAHAKAAEVALLCPDSTVIGADTAVVLGERILGKPASRDDAYRMILSLSGKQHRVLTGLCVMLRARGIIVSDFAVTYVRFKTLTEHQISGYLDTHTFLDKAGAYGIQDIGSVFVDSIDGSFENVVGLPLEKTTEMIAAAQTRRSV